MGVSQDEQAVRQMLADLTVGQPDAPQGRRASIRRRVARRRRSQLAAAALATAIVAAAAIGISVDAGTISPATGSRAVPRWALPWPDHRDGSVPQRVLDSAVTSWRRHFVVFHSAQPLAMPRPPLIWYVGQTVANGQVVVVMFEVHSVIGPRLVAGWATASEVMHGPSGQHRDVSPWVLYDVAAPKRAAGLAIGLNVHGDSSPAGRNPDNWIVVLAAPQVRQATWTEPQADGSDYQGVLVATGTTSRGLLVADTGQMTGRANLIALLGNGQHNTLSHHVWVGVPGSLASQIPQLEQAAPIRLPSWFMEYSGDTGQGTVTTGLAGIKGRLAILGRCYGPAPLRLTYGPKANGSAQVLGTIACDSASHELLTQVRVGGAAAHEYVTTHTSMLTSFRVILGTVR